MKVLALVIVGTALMVSGQESKPHSDGHKQSSTTKHQDATHTAGQTVVVVNQEASQGQENKHPANPPSLLHEYLLPPNVLTLALVIVGIAGIIAAVCTLRTINRQTRVMVTQAKIARVSARAAIFGVAATKRSAEAAKLSADIAAGVAIPTLKIESFAINNIGNGSNLSFFQRPAFAITVKNYGQTPAFLQWWSLKITCEELPEVPSHEGGIASGMPLEKQVVPAGETFTLPELAFYRQHQLSLDDAKAIISHDKGLWVYGYICYRDIFGSPLRRFKFCEQLLNIFEGGELLFEWTELFSPPGYIGTDLYPVKKKQDTDKAN